MSFPLIDPIAFSLGPFALRWYALAYIAGFLAGWAVLRTMVDRFPAKVSRTDLGDLLPLVVLGAVIGGRIGYVLVYDLTALADDPLSLFAIWRGGMSFHGGMVGVMVATWIFCWTRNARFLSLMDAVVCVAPIGLGLGRIANFINGELWGRTSDLPWAVVFPQAGPEPRHPSQLYEAVLEGLVLFLLLRLIAYRTSIPERPGATGGIFLCGYAAARILAEGFREPDRHLGFVAGPLTMGMVLSIPMFIVGALLLALARRPN